MSKTRDFNQRDRSLHAPALTPNRKTCVAGGINVGLNTRVFFGDETEVNVADPELNIIEWENRRGTLIAARTGRNGAIVHQFEIRLQGENETVFFDV